MADTLKQVGKRLKRNQDNTRYNLSRYSRNFPLVERSRDVVTSTLPFVMEFPAVAAQKTRITFHFLEALPTGTGHFYTYAHTVAGLGGPPFSVFPDSTPTFSMPSDLPSQWEAAVTGVLIVQDADNPHGLGLLPMRLVLYHGATEIDVNDGFGSDEATFAWNNHWDTPALANLYFDSSSGLVANDSLVVTGEKTTLSSDQLDFISSPFTLRIWGMTDS